MQPKRAVKKVVGQAEGHHVAALKRAIADAQKKMADSDTLTPAAAPPAATSYTGSNAAFDVVPVSSPTSCR
jgi:hypothetical protein